MKSAELRQVFLDFFHARQHEIVPSSSLVPGNDPTLLFTNAGMVPFKNLFLGDEKRHYVRATSSQRCVRAGGKHNDLENVGYTARHHTFFEMLGNFSFGDYFKREAIHYAWEFLTEELKLPAERLWITVFEDDDEAADIWLKEIGVDAARLSRIGAKDNFWSMGDTGPCGPCSEIFYDHGEAVPGGPPGTPEEDGDRYIEIWNLVFMQYDRDASGKLNPLPKPSVDTGMGLERLAAILQGVHSNYEIDLFQHLIKAAASVTRTDDTDHKSLRVIADHIRSCAFLIVDGVLPGNEGRSYVLRRIIRRAVRHGYRLGVDRIFFYKLVGPLCDEMGAAYPELVNMRTEVEDALRREEERFAETLSQGMKILENDLAELSGSVIPGDTVFKLYDTYGFPLDLTADIAREKGLTLDEAGFERAMEAQRERARAASQFGIAQGVDLKIEGETIFVGYEHLDGDANIEKIYYDGAFVDAVANGQTAMIVLDSTPFYATSGGQEGDHGIIDTADGIFAVNETTKLNGKIFMHAGILQQGTLRVGDKVRCRVDMARRQAIRLNHSATHLLHAALRKILGEHVQQKGSLVDPERLRFDFSHFEAMTREQISKIEHQVNDWIRSNDVVKTNVMNMEDAVKSGAMALFGEKYSDQVRVLSMGQHSVELCGGTHVSSAGDIGLLKITSESGIASGIRRIEAVTGANALAWLDQREQQLQQVADLLKSTPEVAVDKLGQMLEKTRVLEKELDQIKTRMASQQGQDLTSQAVDINGVQVLAARLDGVDVKAMRTTMDQLKDKLGHAVVVLGMATDADKVNLIAGVSKSLTKQLKAGDLIKVVAAEVGGKGGGRPDMAQAGGDRPGSLDAALALVQDWVRTQLL
ncbi:MAG: alanine--tRNA ligase [Gammaproteobacteria bacterium]|nr:alanine--tRNA ligase [Gammaproteobacteria bacterium]